MRGDITSLDEFMTKRAQQLKGDRLFKAAKAPASWNDETRTGRFVMSTQDTDRDGDVVFTKGIDLTSFLTNPICLLNHEYEEPIGSWSNISKAPSRMEGDATIIKHDDVPEANKTAALVSLGILRTVSIGFIPKTVKRIVLANGEPTWSWEIMECELVECSIVSIPANPMALAKGLKETGIAYDLICEVLDTYAKDPATGLIVPKAEFEAAHKAMTGNRTTVVVNSEEAEVSPGMLAQITAALKGVFATAPATEIIAAQQAAISEEIAAIPDANEIAAAKAKALAALAA